MSEATSLTPLGYQILEHWKRHRPTMVATLEKGNQLQQAIFAAQELTGNLLYELTVIRKMDYQTAWEIATREPSRICCRSRNEGRRVLLARYS